MTTLTFRFQILFEGKSTVWKAGISPNGHGKAGSLARFRLSPE
jgi:hypothetical protein